MTENGTTNGIASPLIDKGHHPMEIFLKEKAGPALSTKAGDIIEGLVMEKRGNRLFIDLQSRGTGIVYGREFYDAQSIIKNLNPGDSVSAKIVDLDNEDGYVELSLSEAGKEKEWQEIKRIMETETVLPLKVNDANRGGLIVEYKGIQGFLPASQLSQEHYPRVDGGDKKKILDELKKLVGTELQLKIIDINRDEEKLIFSEKSKNEAETKELLSKYQVGDIVDGEVTGVVSFGAFVKLAEGVEGLVHISELDWQLIENPADVIKSGDKVRAKIIDISGDRVSLSIKALKDDPWVKVPERYKKGDVVTGKTVKYNPFGAFIKLDPEIQGLAHISEFGTEDKMKERVRLNEEYKFKVLSVDPNEHRLALGLIERHPDRPEINTDTSLPTPVEEPREEIPAATENPAAEAPKNE